jgi:TonB family protein
VEDVVVQKNIPGTGFSEAAAKAVKQVRFKPAKQRDQAIGVWIAIPINFRLRADNSHS